MKHLFTSALAAAALAAGSLAHAQPVENTRPLFASPSDSYSDTSQAAPEISRSGRGSGAWRYDSHNPNANSANWGVGG